MATSLLLQPNLKLNLFPSHQSHFHPNFSKHFSIIPQPEIRFIKKSRTPPLKCCSSIINTQTPVLLQKNTTKNQNQNPFVILTHTILKPLQKPTLTMVLLAFFLLFYNRNAAWAAGGARMGGSAFSSSSSSERSSSSSGGSSSSYSGKSPGGSSYSSGGSSYSSGGSSSYYSGGSSSSSSSSSEESRGSSSSSSGGSRSSSSSSRGSRGSSSSSSGGSRGSSSSSSSEGSLAAVFPFLLLFVEQLTAFFAFMLLAALLGLGVIVLCSMAKRIFTAIKFPATVFACMILAVLLGLWVIELCLMAKRSLTAAENAKNSVLKLQVALLGSARSLQRDLGRTCETADTSKKEGLTYVLTEATVAMLRHPDFCISGYSSVDVKSSLEDVERQFNHLSIEERGKFDEETLVNVNNIKKQSTRNKISTGLKNEYIVVTILVAAKGVHKLPAISSSKDLKEALKMLGSIPTIQTLAVEVLWTPHEEDDMLTEQEVLEKYPNLRAL